MAIHFSVEPSPLRKHFDYLADNKLDVRKLVGSTQNLLCLAKPLIDAVKFLLRIGRWEYFWTTVTVLLLCNSSCIVLPPLYSTLAVCVIFLSLLGLGLCHQKYGILTKAFPVPLREEDCDLLGHHECMQEFRLLLLVMDEFVKQCSDRLLQFYSILKLDDLNFAIKCYAVLFCFVLLLFLFPLRIVVAFIIDLIFFYHPIQMRLHVIRPSKTESTTADLLNKDVSSTPSSTQHYSAQCGSPQSNDTASQSSDVQADPGFGTDSEGSEKLAEESSSGDEISVSEISAAVDASTQRLENKPETNIRGPASGSVVGRLLDLKKRRQNIKERCTGCGVMFTTILKRRHICNHCGNHFCSRCCSHKVPRSTFGATAPAAQTETVSVCFQCFSILTGTVKDKAS